jgi:hypothetical protein
MSDPDSFRVEPAEKPDDFQAMLIGAALVYFISIIPVLGLTVCCCIPQTLGALLAVYWYTNKYKITISPGKGIVLGILTALLGGIAAYITGFILLKLGFNPMGDMMQGVLEQVIQMAEENTSPEEAEKLREQIERALSGEKTAIQIVIDSVFTVIVNAIGGVIGGSIGAAVFKKAPPAAPAV